MDAFFLQRASPRTIFTLCAILLLAIVSSRSQTACVSRERIAALKNDVVVLKDPKPDDKLRDQILSINAQEIKDLQTAAKKEPDNNKKSPLTEAITQKVAEQLCSILSSNAWPVKSTVGPEAASIWIRLIRINLPFSVQRELAQVISAAVEKNEVDKNLDLAAMIDRLRLAAGAPQIFGTQAVPQNGFLVLWPLQSEERADAFRADYGMGRLRDGIRSLELSYRMPVVRSTAKAAKVPVSRGDDSGRGDTPLLPNDTGEKEVMRVDTSLVSIDAVVNGPASVKLEKSDFKIFEDGQEQQVEVFGAAESPSDVVLLLDLSGSTADKIGLIKKTTKQFIEMKRDVDRVAIVTFAGGQTVVSPLEIDKAKLLDRVGKLKDSGESKVWDSIKFALDLLNRESPKDRRRAVVVMTDGVDNALAYEPGFGSNTLFADLLEAVRNGTTAVFPIYLDTEGNDSVSNRMYGDARRTLQLLADESGGVYYAAKDIENLSEVYAKVLKDLGQVYSLGYEPKNSVRDGAWRSIKVEIPGHPELKVRARTGYYAK